MRCPDCNKFVSFDTDVDPDVNVSVDKDGHVSGTVRIANSCAECGTELKEATLDVDVDLAELVKKHFKEDHGDATHDLSVDLEASRTDRLGGKPGTPPRYRKMYYGAGGTVEVSCDACDKIIGTADWSDEVQASGMDEL